MFAYSLLKLNLSLCQRVLKFFRKKRDFGFLTFAIVGGQESNSSIINAESLRSIDY
jgi:hypothetical protein